KNSVELEDILEKAIAGRDREPLLKILEEADVPATPAKTVDQVMNDPQTAERGIVQRVRHTKLGEIPVVGTPLRFSRMNPGRRPGPALRCAHTAEILAEAGYTPARIQALRDKNVVI